MIFAAPGGVSPTFDSEFHARSRDSAWLSRLVCMLPARWQDAIGRKWEGAWSAFEEMRRAANLDALHTVHGLMDAQRAGLRADAGDDEIKARAEVFARHYADGQRGKTPEDAATWAVQNMARHGMAEHWPLKERPTDTEAERGRALRAALARVSCVRFWRRVLRKVFASTIERCSIGLGLVNKARDCYVSNLSVARHAGQQSANRRAMEATELENEYGQRMKLSDLADKGTANLQIRLGELMVRISGMDRIARDLQHDGVFVTVTCPSRMHKWADRDGAGVVPNRRYDGTTPRQAHEYLTGQWSKMRAAMDRRGIDAYGFRVAEPHHDGCPHWHLLLFFPPGRPDGTRTMDALGELFSEYFLLNDSPKEPGASKHRVKMKAIDWSMSAAGYIAKYIAKNVNGYKVGADLYGAPAIESSQRVQAWASTWRIRQFQQQRGATVGVWRELRRINPEGLRTDLLPEPLAVGLRGVNIGQVGGLTAHGYQQYTMAQGGPCVRRVHQAIRLLRQHSGEVNRYGEVRAPDVIGVQSAGKNWHRPKHMVDMLGDLAPRVPRPAFAQVETERCAWATVHAGRSVFEARGAAAGPWTRVNNCTDTVEFDNVTMRDKVRMVRSKVGRFKNWAKVPDPAPGRSPGEPSGA